MGREKSTTRSLRTTLDGDCSDMLSKYSPFQSVIDTGAAVGVKVGVGLLGTEVGVALAGEIGVGDSVGVALATVGRAVGHGSGSGLVVKAGVIIDVAVGAIGVSTRVASRVAVITGARVAVGLAGVKNLKRRYANMHKSTVRTPTRIHRILNRFILQDLLSARDWS